MRLAVLTLRDLGDAAAASAPMLRTYRGQTLAQRQLELALDLGCTLIACCIDRLEEPVLDLQRRAEAAGARFVTVRAGRGLVGAATAGDEVLVLAPALLPDAEACARLLAAPAILTLPADHAVPLGYERIDAQESWAGALVTRASALEGLAHLPDDADIASSLLRLALQSGTRRLLIDPALVDSGHWQLAPTQDDLDMRAARWIADRAALASFAAPGRAVAERIGLRLARGAAHSEPARAVVLAGLIGALGAVACALREMPLAALAAAWVSAVLAAIAAVLARIEGTSRSADQPQRLGRALAVAVDPALVVALAAAAPEADGWLRVFVPLVLFLALALAERHGPARWRPLASDRVVLAGLFLPAAALGVSQILAAVLTVATLVAILRKPAEG